MLTIILFSLRTRLLHIHRHRRVDGVADGSEEAQRNKRECAENVGVHERPESHGANHTLFKVALRRAEKWMVKVARKALGHSARAGPPTHVPMAQ